MIKVLKLNKTDNKEYNYPITIIGYNYNYDILKKTKQKVKSIKLKQKNCNHEFTEDIYTVDNADYINNPNNRKVITIINSIISFFIEPPRYARICKHCGKVEYFCNKDEAETYPTNGIGLFNVRRYKMSH